MNERWQKTTTQKMKNERKKKYMINDEWMIWDKRLELNLKLKDNILWWKMNDKQ